MMQRKIAINELERTINNIDEIEEPLIIKRKNKKDLVLLNLEEYETKIASNELSAMLAESEEEYKQGKTHRAEEVFKELRKKYGY